MSDNKKAQTDTETILMALDQVSQTIDVMTSVVGRLRTYVQEQGSTAQTDNAEKTALQSDQTVH
jgi:argininosuccinate lyase